MTTSKSDKRRFTVEEYNKWRNELPDHCWHCRMFDKCHPNQECKWNKLSKRGKKK